MQDAEIKAALEEIVGPVADEGLTPDQRVKLGSHAMEGVVERVKAHTGEGVSNFLLPRISMHWSTLVMPEATEDNKLTVAAVTTWLGNSVQILNDESDRSKYTDYRKANKLPGFAGDRLPDHKLPCANVWFEAAYEPGRYPTLVPVRDVYETNTVKVKRIGILAVHNFATFPFPEDGTENEPNFLKSANVVAYIEDALGTISTFCGSITYGANGGALMWKVNNLDELNAALQGEVPRQNAVGPMSNLSQFVCGELAHLINYHADTKDYETFKRAVRGEPPASGVTEDYDEQ